MEDGTEGGDAGTAAAGKEKGVAAAREVVGAGTAAPSSEGGGLSDREQPAEEVALAEKKHRWADESDDLDSPEFDPLAFGARPWETQPAEAEAPGGAEKSELQQSSSCCAEELLFVASSGAGRLEKVGCAAARSPPRGKRFVRRRTRSQRDGRQSGRPLRTRGDARSTASSRN